MKSYMNGVLTISKVKQALAVWWKLSSITNPSSFLNISKASVTERKKLNDSHLAQSKTESSDICEKESHNGKATTKAQKFVEEQEKEFVEALEDEKLVSNMTKTMSSIHAEPIESLMTKMFHQSNVGKVRTLSKPDFYTKQSVDMRTRSIVKSLRMCSSNMSYHVRLKEMARHVYTFPESTHLFLKEGSLQLLLNIRNRTKDEFIECECREILTLLGYVEPITKSRGLRVLSIDGGGMRGLMALRILQRLEKLTNKPVHMMFDYICGVSTGAILAILLGALRLPIETCKDLYVDISQKVFDQSRVWGAGQLVWNHSYYDTNKWSKALNEAIGDVTMIESARNANCPKIAAVSTVVNQPTLKSFVFRNYTLPNRVQSNYPGSVSNKMWEAIRASAAAPGYFEEFVLDGLVHQDGGILMNNPSALALHECKNLWPNEHIQCVISIGNGRYMPTINSDDWTAKPPISSSPSSSSLAKKITKIIDSATDTEGVHIILDDLLTPGTYYRLNPYLTEYLPLDEVRNEKMMQLEMDAANYMESNQVKMNAAAKQLTFPRTHLQKTNDFVDNVKRFHLWR
ncbi:PNPLA8 (predicted) [Pycnogonum litorale]